MTVGLTAGGLVIVDAALEIPLARFALPLDVIFVNVEFDGEVEFRGKEVLVVP